MHQAIFRPTSDKQKKLARLANGHAKLVEAEKLRRAGDLDKARSICESILNEFPDYVRALQILGAIHLAKKDYWPALSCFTRAAMRCPKDWVTLCNLAAVYVGLDARELATMTLQQAHRLKPDDAEIHFTMGEIYQEEREYELAAEAYQRALKLNPGYALAAHGLGESYSKLGRDAEAAAAYEKLHKLRPSSVGCLYGLAQLPPSVVSIDIMRALEKLRGSKRQSEEDFQRAFAFAIASALDRKGRYKEAWETLLEANRDEYPKHESSYRKQLARQDASRTAALEQLVNSAPASRTRNIPLSLFIIGVSRSGKTTLERLVSVLEGTKRGHESHLTERAIKRASQNSGLLTLTHLNDLPKWLDGEFRKLYMEELSQFAGEARLLTNTHPGMIYSVGRVAAALPDSRFVFVKRDRHDIALRIFGKIYRAGNHYAYDLKTIFHYITWYYEMVDIWLGKLPSVCRVIHYEDMIADPHATLQTVAELCGVPMPEDPLPDLGDDRGCAAPYKEMMAFARAAEYPTAFAAP